MHLGLLLAQSAAATGTDVALQADTLTCDLGGAGPGISSLSIQFNTDGTITTTFGTTNQGSAPLNTSWFTDSSGASIRWIKVTNISGTPSSGTTGSVLALTSNRLWSIQSSVGGVKSWTGQYQMYSDAGGTTPIGSAVNIAMSANGA